MNAIIPDEVLSKMLESIANRYTASNDLSYYELLKGFYKDPNENIRVLRIRRSSSDKASWKTILFAFNINEHSIPLSFTWAAAVQQELLNNESSDLYLFIIPNADQPLPKENCIYIESNDQYCRKYVMRPGETFEELLNRTFLYNFETSSVVNEISDPLVTALQKTGEAISSFSEDEQTLWKSILLSGQQGFDMALKLINPPSQNSQNDKT
jgi:hypothetical protein